MKRIYIKYQFDNHLNLNLFCISVDKKHCVNLIKSEKTLKQCKSSKINDTESTKNIVITECALQ